MAHIYGYSLRAYAERRKKININTNVVIFGAVYILSLLSCDTMKNGMTTYVVTVINIIIFIITFIKMVILTMFCWILVGPYSYKYETFLISEQLYHQVII